MKTNKMVICAVFSALICIFSVMTVPLGIIPITLGTFAIMLTSVILGYKYAPLSVLVFILLGAVGLPVFSGFRGGFQVIAGPTGGYIWSYIPMVATIGILTKKLPKQKFLATFKIFIACLVGMVICYALGTIQFMFVQKTGFIEAVTICVIPFILWDIIKALSAAFIGYTLRKALKRYI